MDENRPVQASQGSVGQLWTPSDVATYLGINEKTVRRMASRGDLPCVRVGSRLRFDPSDITRWVSARKEGG